MKLRYKYNVWSSRSFYIPFDYLPDGKTSTVSLRKPAETISVFAGAANFTVKVNYNGCSLDFTLK